MCRELLIPVALAGTRLDLALAQLAAVSRGEARRLIAAGRVTIGGRPCRIAGRLVTRGTALQIHAPAAAWNMVEPRLVQERDDWIVVDKPRGVAVQPGRKPDLPHLLAWWQLRHLRQPLWVIHRLDVPVSGLVLLARQACSAARLSAALREQRIERRYRARVAGSMGLAPGTTIEINAPLRKQGGCARVDPAGQPASTRVTVLSCTPAGDELEVQLATGRFHQIRAHLAHHGLPIVGDRRYGGAAAQRLYLHAATLAFHDCGQHHSYHSPAPWSSDLADHEG
jgi:RluA family pseudouridine synthase